MNSGRWLGLAVVIVLLLVAFAAYNWPGRIGGLNADSVTNLIWALMALLLVTGAGYGFRRFDYHRGYALAGILFWPALIVAIVFAYEAFR